MKNCYNSCNVAEHLQIPFFSNKPEGFLVLRLSLLLISSYKDKGDKGAPSQSCSHKQGDTLCFRNCLALTHSCNQKLPVDGCCFRMHSLKSFSLLLHYRGRRILWVPARNCDTVFVGLSGNVVITTWIQQEGAVVAICYSSVNENMMCVHLHVCENTRDLCLCIGFCFFRGEEKHLCASQPKASCAVQIVALRLQLNLLFFSSSSFSLPLWLSSCHTL